MSQSPSSGTPNGSVPVEPPRKRRPAWLVPLIAAVVLLLLLLLLLSQCAGGDDTDTDGTAAGAGAGASAGATTEAPSPSASPTPSVTIEETTTPSPSPSATAGSTASPTAGEDGSSATATAGAGADASLVTAGGTSVLGLAADSSAAGLASVDGQDVRATGVAVESVPADEGFWVGSGDQRVWVQLDGEGESDFQIESGEQLDFTGQVVANDQTFLDQLTLVGEEDGLTQLQEQGYHLLVDRGTVEAVG